jgi:hypothetical protein
MALKCSILVLANRTALSAALEAALRAQAAKAPTTFTLVLPIGRSADAHRRAQETAEQLSAAGLEVRGVAGDTDPLRAVAEVWNPAEFDEIIVSTLPASASRWLRASLPAQIGRYTGALVHHVESREAPSAASRPAVASGGR